VERLAPERSGFKAGQGEVKTPGENRIKEESDRGDKKKGYED